MIPKLVIIHHTASSRTNTTLENVNDWHKARDFNLSGLGYYVGYHYLITGDGIITQTRRDNEIGCHCIPNWEKLGICLTGNFDIEEPTKEQLYSLTELLGKLKQKWDFTDYNIYGHCEKSRTACPGQSLFKWLKLYRQISFLQQAINKIIAILKGRQS